MTVITNSIGDKEINGGFHWTIDYAAVQMSCDRMEEIYGVCEFRRFQGSSVPLGFLGGKCLGFSDFSQLVVPLVDLEKSRGTSL